MMKIRVSEASGAVLDWLVENADLRGRLENTEQRASITNRNIRLRHEWSPSVNWAQGGPIIERHPIQVGLDYRTETFVAFSQNGVSQVSFGPTPLIAAMRCYVASKLGDTVEVPEELV